MKTIATMKRARQGSSALKRTRKSSSASDITGPRAIAERPKARAVVSDDGGTPPLMGATPLARFHRQIQDAAAKHRHVADPLADAIASSRTNRPILITSERYWLLRSEVGEWRFSLRSAADRWESNLAERGIRSELTWHDENTPKAGSQKRSSRSA
jgi:hypothetical protein